MKTPESPASLREVVLIGLEDDLRERIASYFSDRGWNVTTASTGPEGRKLVRLLGARVAVLDETLPCESARLTCAKLRVEYKREQLHLVLIVDEDDHTRRSFAHFVGARVQFRQDEDLGGLPQRLEHRPQEILLRA